MIDEEKIYEEANGVYDEKFRNDTYGIIYYDNGDEDEAHTPCQVTEAFIMGAQWAQKEFVKSLWHDASEEPRDHTDIVYVNENGSVWSEYDYYADNYDDAFHKGWLSFVNNGVLRVIKWCYLSDILPKEGGEE